MEPTHTEGGSASVHPADEVAGGVAALAGCSHGSEAQLVTKRTGRSECLDHRAAAANRRIALSWVAVQILRQAPFGSQDDWEHCCHRTA